MKKRRIFLMLAMVVVMVSTLFLTTVVAADGTSEDVAQIGESKYKTFAEAYTKATNGDTITLLADANWEQTVKNSTTAFVEVKKDLTIDLSGHTLSLVPTGTTKYGLYICVKSPGKLTVKDSSDGGKLTSTSGYYVALLSGGDLLLQSGTLESNSSTRTVHVNNRNSTFTMNGGTLVNGKPSMTANNAVLGVQNGKAVISGGSLKSTSDKVPCVKLEGATLEIEEGSFITPNARAILVAKDSATLTLSGGSFTGCGPDTASVSLEEATSAEKITIGTDNSTTKFSLPKLSLKANAAVKIGDNVVVGDVVSTDNKDYIASTSSFGGTYLKDISEFLAPIGLKCVANDDDTYQTKQLTDEDVVATITRGSDTMKYYNLKSALRGLQNGDVLTLKKDVETTSAEKFEYSVQTAGITIDLNNFSIKAPNATYGLYVHTASGAVGEITIHGPGTISGKKYGVYTEVNGSSGQTYTVEIDSTVSLTGSTAKAYLGSEFRLKLVDGGITAEDTNATVQTTIDGTTYLYNDVAPAINDQTTDGGIVTLLDDSVVSDPNIANERAVTLDLNGHTLSSNQQNGLVCDGKDLTIKNGTFGYNCNNSSAGFALGMDQIGKTGAKLTLENVTINAKAPKSQFLTAFTVNGTLENVSVELKNCTITAEGADADGLDTVGVYFPVKGGTLDIIDTKITAMNAVQVKGGTVTVEEKTPGATVITSTGPHAEPESSDNGSGNTGDGIYVEDTYGHNPIVKITSGAVISEGKGTKALNYYDNGDQEGPDGSIEVSGGNFSNSVMEYVDAEKQAELVSTAVNPDAPYSYYQDSSAAVAAATAAGDTEATVNLLNADTTNTKTVTLDVSGGQLSVSTITAKGNTAISLPTPTRSGYVFQGWSDGEKVYQDSYTVGNTDVKLTAQWAYIPPTYTVAVPTADNGKLSVSPKYAVGGQTVTITVAPDEGYELDTLTVTDAKGNELELKDLGDGMYSFKMPYGKANVNATFVETEPEPVIDPVKDCDKDGTCPAAKFTDVDRNAWYHDGVHYCISEGLMNGTGATTFEPLATTNRAMLVTILYRLEGEPAVGENQFADVAADEWYTKAVSWAADNGIVKGYGDGTFGPMDIITREQMATILHRYAAYKGYDVTAKGDLSFTDADEVSDWAKDAMTWAVGAELINGVGDNRLEPEGNAQRAQIATILYRFCEKVAK